MTWREAFIAQAKHDYAMFRQFNEQHQNGTDQLHYLQMAAEKLARGFLASSTDSAPPPMTHAGIVRMLQHLKSNPSIRRQLGYGSIRAFSAYIDSLLGIAGRVQALAPAIAGITQPNPEYPWAGTPQSAVTVPCQHDFSELLNNSRLPKLLKLIGRLMAVVES